MTDDVKAVAWEAPEHNHCEKTGDWFWILGIVTVVGALTMFFFGNFLFAILILIAGLTIGLVANQEPTLTHFAVSTRGLRVGNSLYPYSTLECFYIDEDNLAGPQLLARSKKMFMSLIVMPIPEEYVDDIESILEVRLPEEHLEEPLAHKLLEIFGF
ncbi:hypothetical protein CL653_01100 [bacterium]|nr:hypothetical protein [bacterium]|tara:strand:- start:1763 stop:2233 length:471 start_codon:yes stop_codon:yes gene_type:complete